MPPLRRLPAVSLLSFHPFLAAPSPPFEELMLPAATPLRAIRHLPPPIAAMRREAVQWLLAQGADERPVRITEAGA